MSSVSSDSSAIGCIKMFSNAPRWILFGRPGLFYSVWMMAYKILIQEALICKVAELTLVKLLQSFECIIFREVLKMYGIIADFLILFVHANIFEE